MKNQMVPNYEPMIKLQTFHIVHDIMLARNKHFQMNEESLMIFLFLLLFY